MTTSTVVHIKNGSRFESSAQTYASHVVGATQTSASFTVDGDGVTLLFGPEVDGYYRSQVLRQIAETFLAEAASLLDAEIHAHGEAYYSGEYEDQKPF
jgi:hypothetical protein